MTGRRWTITWDEQRPWSVNEQVRWHHHRRADMVRTWRHGWAVLARQQRVPRLEMADVTVRCTVAPGKRLWDAGNDFYAVKAAVDGLVDAGVLPDDSPAYLRTLAFVAPVRGDHAAVTLTVTEVAPPDPAPRARHAHPVPVYDHEADRGPQTVTLAPTEARALLNLLRAATLTDPHHQRIAGDLQAVLLREGVRNG